MKKDTCFVCIGQCGGNIGMLLEEKGYDVLYLNTAKCDLDLLKKPKHVFKIPGIDGCCQDPDKAQNVFAAQYKRIMDKITQFAERRIVYFVSASSGGTSGMTPLVLDAYLEHLGKVEDAAWEKYYERLDNGENPDEPRKRKAGLITVMPSLSESVILNANSYNYLKMFSETLDRELAKDSTNLANCFLLDNEMRSDILEVNKEFVNGLDEWFKVPENHKSVKGNVDSADLERAMTQPGITVFAALTKQEFSISKLVEVLKGGTIFASNDDLMGSYWVSSTTEEIDSNALEKEIGAPIAHYKTYNEMTNLFLVSGLGMPEERIGLMFERAGELATRKAKRNSDVFGKSVKIETPKPVAPPPATRPVAGREEHPQKSPTHTATSMEDRLQLLRRRRR